jgi:hypothetical protein
MAHELVQARPREVSCKECSDPTMVNVLQNSLQIGSKLGMTLDLGGFLDSYVLRRGCERAIPGEIILFRVDVGMARRAGGSIWKQKSGILIVKDPAPFSESDRRSMPEPRT